MKWRERNKKNIGGGDGMIRNISDVRKRFNKIVRGNEGLADVILRMNLVIGELESYLEDKVILDRKEFEKYDGCDNFGEYEKGTKHNCDINIAQKDLICIICKAVKGE